MDNVEDLSHLYQPFTSEAAEEEAEKLPSNATLKLVEGKQVMRFLPAPQGWASKAPWLLVHEHWIEQPGGRVGFPCLVAHRNERCPGCTKAEQLRKTGNEADRETAEKIAAKPVAFAHVIERKHPEKGVQTLRISQGVLRDLLKLRADTFSGDKDFTDPLLGYDLQFTGEKKGNSKWPEFKIAVAQHSSPLMRIADGPEQGRPDVPRIKELLTTRPDLMKFLRIRGWQEIVDLVNSKSGSGAVPGQTGGAGTFDDTQRPAVGPSVGEYATQQPPAGFDADSDIPF